jgi:hypothetical protein
MADVNWEGVVSSTLYLGPYPYDTASVFEFGAITTIR